MLSEPLPPTTIRPSRPEVGERLVHLGDAVGVVVGASPLGAEHGAALGERAAHGVDGEGDGAPFAHAVPGVGEADDLVTVVALALAHDGAEHRVEPGAVASAGQDPDTHDGIVGATPRGRHEVGVGVVGITCGLGFVAAGELPPAAQGVGDLRGDHDGDRTGAAAGAQSRRPDRRGGALAAALRGVQCGDGQVRVPAQDAVRDAHAARRHVVCRHVVRHGRARPGRAR